MKIGKQYIDKRKTVIEIVKINTKNGYVLFKIIDIGKEPYTFMTHDKYFEYTSAYHEELKPYKEALWLHWVWRCQGTDTLKQRRAGNDFKRTTWTSIKQGI